MKSIKMLMFGVDAASNYSYGRLYNWFAASNANIAPVGYHVPTSTELQTLKSNIGDSLAGGNLKAEDLQYWDSPNTGATNQYGMNATGSGYRNTVGDFVSRKQFTSFWSSTSLSNTNATRYVVSYNSSNFNSESVNKLEGASIRFIKDDSVNNGSVADYDGNIYETIKIGSQVWTTSNFKGVHYNNGISIENVTSASRFIKMDAVIPEYGNFYTLIDIQNANLPPNANWIVPSYTDFQALVAYLGGASVAGPKLKSNNLALWQDGTVFDTPSGFNAVGCGYYDNSSNILYDFRNSARFCCTSIIPQMYGAMYVYYSSSNVLISTSLPAIYWFNIRLLWVGSGAAPSTVTDIDGNVYNTIQIGEQYWTTTNFKATRDRLGNTLSPNYFDPYNSYSRYFAGVYSDYNNDPNSI